METLFTPWRRRYVTSAAAPDERTAETGCFFCVAAAGQRGDSDCLVVGRTAHHVVLLNLHPYTSGHTLVAPLGHWGCPEEAPPETHGEFWSVVLRVRAMLETVYRPQGMNLGMNLGPCSGAGVPGHYHFHLVPRWNGDTNFLGAVAATRLIPEDPYEARVRLARAWNGDTA
jgi:ATP adenylyltransferase